MFSINKIVILLILSNFFIESAFGFIAPVFSVFVLEGIQGGSLAVAGFAAAIYYIAKSIMQLPIGTFIDKISEERVKFFAVISGHVLMGTAAFLYLLAETPFHIYGIQLLLALGAAISTPSWYVLFSRHLDKLKEAFEWSLNSSITLGLGVGVASAVGGIITETFGFNAVFILAGSIGVGGGLTLLPIYKYIARASNETKPLA